MKQFSLVPAEIKVVTLTFGWGIPLTFWLAIVAFVSRPLRSIYDPQLLFYCWFAC
jgi:hypothetical protein